MNKEDLYLKIINGLSDGVYYVDFNRIITFWNRTAEAITGYTSAEMVGHNCGDNILNHIDSEGRPLCVVGCPLFAVMSDGVPRQEEVFLRHKDGRRIPVFVNIFPIFENDKIVGAAEVFTPNSPITYDDDLVERLSSLALRDMLTGLPNRRYLQNFMEYKINETIRYKTSVAVLFLDIDNFRDFNNAYGHDVGDNVLRAISDTIRANTRKTDMFGRWGGEEFVGVYSISSSDDLPLLAEKIRLLICGAKIQHEIPLSVTSSIGITEIRFDDTVRSIIERSDKLMYQSKNRGKNCFTCE